MAKSSLGAFAKDLYIYRPTKTAIQRASLNEEKIRQRKAAEQDMTYRPSSVEIQAKQKRKTSSVKDSIPSNVNACKTGSREPALKHPPNNIMHNRHQNGEEPAQTSGNEFQTTSIEERQQSTHDGTTCKVAEWSIDEIVGEPETSSPAVNIKEVDQQTHVDKLSTDESIGHSESSLNGEIKCIAGQNSPASRLKGKTDQHTHNDNLNKEEALKGSNGLIENSLGGETKCDTEARKSDKTRSKDKTTESCHPTKPHVKTVVSNAPLQKPVLHQRKPKVQQTGWYYKPGNTGHVTPAASRNKRLNANLEFYQNKIRSKPYPGDKIEDMLRWKGDYNMLERNHRYIQWLFPIPDGSGMNRDAQPLQEHEAQAIRSDDALLKRVLQAYKMMLDFYGMELVSSIDGQVRRCERNWKQRYKHLNKYMVDVLLTLQHKLNNKTPFSDIQHRHLYQHLMYTLLEYEDSECIKDATNNNPIGITISRHNYLRITRIIKSLGELGYERFQVPWLDFFFQEIVNKNQLQNIKRTKSVLHWIDAVSDDHEREMMFRSYSKFMGHGDREEVDDDSEGDDEEYLSDYEDDKTLQNFAAGEK